MDIFAKNGNRDPVATTPQPSGEVNWETGYPSGYEANPATDPTAKLIERTKYNEVLYRLTKEITDVIVAAGIIPDASQFQLSSALTALVSGAGLSINDGTVAGDATNNTKALTAQGHNALASNAGGLNQFQQAIQKAAGRLFATTGTFAAAIAQGYSGTFIVGNAAGVADAPYGAAVATFWLCEIRHEGGAFAYTAKATPVITSSNPAYEAKTWTKQGTNTPAFFETPWRADGTELLASGTANGFPFRAIKHSDGTIVQTFLTAILPVSSVNTVTLPYAGMATVTNISTTTKVQTPTLSSPCAADFLSSTQIRLSNPNTSVATPFFVTVTGT
jgi:hypothetical protein